MVGLDIVIVNWNAGVQLRDCLASIASAEQASTFCISKCSVVDNASTDASADHLDYPSLPLHVTRNSDNRGFGAACNQGAADGEAEYVLFLNPDSKLYPHTLTQAVSFLEQPDHRQIGLLGVQIVDGQGQVQPSAGRFPTPGAVLYQMVGLDRLWPTRFPPQVMDDWDHRETRPVDMVQGAFILARRTTFEQVHGFDERFFMYYEDVDLAYRARQQGWSTWYLADTRVYHRGGGVTERIKARRLAYWMQSRVQYIQRHFGRAAAIETVVASLTVELGARLLLNLARFSRGHLLDTIGAYGQYVAALPGLLRRIWLERRTSQADVGHA